MTAAPASAPASVAEASSKGDGEDDESEEEEEEEDEEEETRYACKCEIQQSGRRFHACMVSSFTLNFTPRSLLSHVKSIGERGEVDSAFSGEAERRSLRIEEVDASEEREEEEEEESIASEGEEEADRYGSRLKETKKSKVSIV